MLFQGKAQFLCVICQCEKSTWLTYIVQYETRKICYPNGQILWQTQKVVLTWEFMRKKHAIPHICNVTFILSSTSKIDVPQREDDRQNGTLSQALSLQIVLSISPPPLAQNTIYVYAKHLYNSSYHTNIIHIQLSQCKYFSCGDVGIEQSINHIIFASP